MNANTDVHGNRCHRVVVRATVAPSISCSIIVLTDRQTERERASVCRNTENSHGTDTRRGSLTTVAMGMVSKRTHRQQRPLGYIHVAAVCTVTATGVSRQMERAQVQFVYSLWSKWASGYSGLLLTNYITYLGSHEKKNNKCENI